MQETGLYSKATEMDSASQRMKDNLYVEPINTQNSQNSMQDITMDKE